MKVTIEFNLPEDGDKYRSMINCGAALDALASETLSTSDQGLEL